MKRIAVRLLALALAAPLLAGVAAEAGKRVSLFNGKDLAGWKVITCEAKADDGSILLASGNGIVQTEKKYGDFVLEFDWKALGEEMWDSGVYFRYDSIPEGRPWPDRYQINFRKGEECSLVGNKDTIKPELIKTGEWNTCKLTVQGSELSMEINGKPAWQAGGLEGPATGYIGLQAEVPGGGQFRFRNIYITELDKE